MGAVTYKDTRESEGMPPPTFRAPWFVGALRASPGQTELQLRASGIRAWGFIELALRSLRKHQQQQHSRSPISRFGRQCGVKLLSLIYAPITGGVSICTDVRIKTIHSRKVASRKVDR